MKKEYKQKISKVKKVVVRPAPLRFAVLLLNVTVPLARIRCAKPLRHACPRTFYGGHRKFYWQCICTLFLMLRWGCLVSTLRYGGNGRAYRLRCCSFTVVPTQRLKDNFPNHYAVQNQKICLASTGYAGEKPAFPLLLQHIFCFLLPPFLGCFSVFRLNRVLFRQKVSERRCYDGSIFYTSFAQE